MCTLNKIGTDFAGIAGVHAMTDVTGFGLLGHLIEMADGSGLTAKLNDSAIPRLKSTDYLASLNRITKRLGMERYQQLQQLMQAALNKTDLSTSLGIHREWIRLLLESYYDPMYQYQRKKKASQIIYHGRAEEVSAFLRQ